MSVKKMLDEIRRAISQCTAGEKESYEALVDEASGWEMQLEELEAEEENA